MSAGYDKRRPWLHGCRGGFDHRPPPEKTPRSLINFKVSPGTIEEEAGQTGLIPRGTFMRLAQDLIVEGYNDPFPLFGQLRNPDRIWHAAAGEFVAFEHDFGLRIENPRRLAEPFRKAGVEEELHAARSWRS